jgi:hypothetical protein
MTNPLITALDETLATETDKREGFDDGFAGKRYQQHRSDTYTQAWLDGAEAKRKNDSANWKGQRND